MNASLNWLRRLVDLPESPEEIAARLTAAGLEVESVEHVFDLPGVIVGEVRRAEKVEGTHLSQCLVFDGNQELPVVCGAPNVRAGLKTALATVGTKLPGGEIRAARVHGMESLGMLCAEDELGLGEGHRGIMELPADFRAGTPLSQALGIADVVFAVDVTPNRPDATGHVGLARELAASFGRPLRNPLEGVSLDGAEQTHRSVSVEPGCGCTRYVGRTIRGLKNGSSPAWMASLLRAVGLRPISALVDVTNFVLMEIGQPLHVFDLAKIEGDLVVRGAREGEKLVTLDGETHELAAGDLVVADRRGPQCLGGVMGGENSGVSDTTTDIFLETAYFNPSVVRRLARRQNLSSDSSYRFERGVNPLTTRQVSDYAATLIQTLCGGTVDEPMDVRLPGHPAAEIIVDTVPEKIAWRLGVPVTAAFMRQVLPPLGFVEQPAVEPGHLAFKVPGWRPDVHEAADISEEIARRLGDAGIPPCEPVYPVTATRLPARERWTRRLRRALASRGLHETLSLRFVGLKDHARMGYLPGDPRGELIKIANPLSDDWAAMPRLGVVNLLRAAVRNENHQEHEIALFECLRVFGRDLPEAFAAHRKTGLGERNVCSGVLAGTLGGRGWGEGKAIDFYGAKGVLQGALRELGVEPVFAACADEPWLHPGRGASISLEGRRLGVFGELHPGVQSAWGLRQTVWAWEIDMDTLVEILESHPFAQVHEVSEFPAMRREISAVVATEFPAGRLLAAVRALPQAQHELLREVSLEDVYQGAGVSNGHKSMLLRFWYQASDRTLTDAQVNDVHNALRDAVGALEGVSLK